MANTKRRWKRSDLTILKREFTNGTRLKVIARILGRTETSVSKELSRSGIRSNNRETQKNIHNICRNYRLRFVDISVVIGYLERIGYKISILGQKSNNGKDMMYKLNDVPSSLIRILIIANKHRLENGFPVFHIKMTEN